MKACPVTGRVSFANMTLFWLLSPPHSKVVTDHISERTFLSSGIRNIAIIAHVDHGKTTLVDAMLHRAATFAPTNTTSNG